MKVKQVLQKWTLIKAIISLFIIGCPMAPLVGQGGHAAEDIFTIIYRDGWWGKNAAGEGTSGDGSTLASTEIYRVFLQGFIRDFTIQSVVDVGCGDWEFSRTMNWDGINYVGYDVVPSVIQKNQQKFQKPNINFICGNAIQAKIPPADLLICKDVLQHLPNEDIAFFIRQFSNFKYCLITNDVDPFTLTSQNPQIQRGHYRFVDLTQPPFRIVGLKVLTYMAGGTTKQVLFVVRPQ